MKIAHFSDLHYCPAHLSEVERCFGFAVDHAIASGVQAAVISGDATDHALDMHAPAAEALARQVRRLAEHCPVLMLQGTFAHEPPGTLNEHKSSAAAGHRTLAERTDAECTGRESSNDPTNLAPSTPSSTDLAARSAPGTERSCRTA